MSTRLEKMIDVDSFLKDVWRQEIKVLARSALLSPQALLETLQRHCRAEVPGGWGDIRAFLDGRVVNKTEEGYRLLPLHDDDTVEAYRARTDKEFADRDWSIVFGNSHARDPLFSMHTIGTFEPLVRRLGLPINGFSTEVFVGKYRSTPFGIHKDPGLESFYQLLVGKKKFWFWDEDTWDPDNASYPRSFEIEREQEKASSAKVVDLETNELLYWPARYYHIAETPEFGLAVGVSLNYPSREGDLSTDVINTILQNELMIAVDAMDMAAEEVFPYAGPSSADTVPPSLIAATRELQNLVQDLPQMLAEWWLQRCSNLGAAGAVSPRHCGEIEENGTVRLHDGATLLHRAMGGELKIACHGMMWATSEHEVIMELLTALASHAPLDIRQYLSETPSDDERTRTSRRDGRELLASMVDVGVLEFERSVG